MTHNVSNPIPRVTSGLRSLLSPQKATEDKAQQPSINKKQEDEQREDAQVEKQIKKGCNVYVRDPTTGEDVNIRNAPKEIPEDEKGGNVLKLPLPEPDWDAHRDTVVGTGLESLRILAATYTFSLLLLLAPLPLSYWHTFSVAFTIIYPVLSLIPALVTTSILVNRLNNTALNSASAHAWHSERIRGVRAGAHVNGDGKIGADESMRESAEWVNALLAGLWPVINPGLFASGVGKIEDIMQSSAPSFVHSVRISDLGLGWNSMRLTSIRALPDAVTEEPLDTLDADVRDRLGGEHVNFEVSFAYSALPSGLSTESKAQNAHLLIDFFLGLTGVLGFSIPIWVEVTGIVGTARVRMQLIPDPPFVKTTLFTLLGLPRITISIVALARALPNMMNIPFLSGFISSSLDTAAAEVVAPKSLILDIQKMIGGGDVNKDTQAIGVLIIHIHRASGLKKMDAIGSSDPYVTFTYSRLGKSLFSTRIIMDELNPVWEEMAVLPLDVNIVKLKEKLSMQLWDFDRRSADHMIGVVEIDILELMRHKNQALRHVAPLSGDHGLGSIEYTAGYFTKLYPNTDLRTDGRDPGLPPDLELPSAEQEKKQRKTRNELEEAVLTCPPDNEWVSGLLGVQVHEIRDLGVGRGGEKDQAQEGEAEEGVGMPSSYCTLSINDQLVYKTRVKPITSSPIFSARTERFVRDWRSTHISVTVRDSRTHEADAVMGVILLKLSDLLVNASQLTRIYHLEHGIGHGRIRISLVFRPVAAKLPPQLRGFEIGTLRVREVRLRVDPAHRKDLVKTDARIQATTGPYKEKLPRKSEATDEGDEIIWTQDGGVEIPVHERYCTALTIAFKGTHMMSNVHTMAVLWLRDIVDNEPATIELALFASGNESTFMKLKQNYVPTSGDLSALENEQQGALGLSKIGTAVVGVEFVPGIGEKHKSMLGADQKGGGKGMWEEVQHESLEGGREGVGEVGEEGERPHQDNVPSPTKVSPQEPAWQAGQRDQESGPSMAEQGDTGAWAGGLESGQAVHKRGGSTTVSHEYVEIESGSSEEGGEGHTDDEQYGEKKKRRSPMKTFRDWREKEHELHAHRQGIT